MLALSVSLTTQYPFANYERANVESVGTLNLPADLETNALNRASLSQGLR